jgi:hypothetical protein
MSTGGPIPGAKRGLGVTLTIQPRSSISRSYISSPTWRLQGVAGHFYFYVWQNTPFDFTVPVIFAPNVVVKWLTFLLRIRKVPGLNLGPETSYSDWGFFVVSSVSPADWYNTLKLGHDRFLPHPFQLIIHLSPLHSTLFLPELLQNVVK